MNAHKDKGRLPPFVPIDKEMMDCPAWRNASCGARVLYMHLKRRWSFKQRNNGRIYLSGRDAEEEIGCGRDSIERWYRELQHYGKKWFGRADIVANVGSSAISFSLRPYGWSSPRQART